MFDVGRCWRELERKACDTLPSSPSSRCMQSSMSVLDWSSSPAVNGWLGMQAATWRCDANDVAVATAAAAVRRSDVGELHVRSIRPTMAHCDAWKKRKGKATATLRMSASIACRRLAKRGFSSGKLGVRGNHCATRWEIPPVWNPPTTPDTQKWPGALLGPCASA